MKVQKMLSLDHEIVLELKEEANASLLINNMLREHYQGKKSKPSNEIEIIKEVKEKLSEEERSKKIDSLVTSMTNEQEREYREGLKNKLWKSYYEYAEIKVT